MLRGNPSGTAGPGHAAKVMKFTRELYPKTALLKAAYTFTPRAYVHLDADEHSYYVTLMPKEGSSPVSDREFLNEMIVQTVRHAVYLQTKDLRELLAARALASTMIGHAGSQDEETNAMPDTAAGIVDERILMDWFEAQDDGPTAE